MSSSDLMFDTSASARAVVKALTTTDGIASFWTSRIDGDAGVDQQMTLTFPGPQGVVDYVLSTTKATADSATWAYIDGDNPGWAGTEMSFAVVPSPMGEGTMVRFTHGSFADGSMTPYITWIWAQILTRLKAYLEHGTVDPFFAAAA